MRGIAIGLVLLGAAAPAEAHGPSPFTISIQSRPGHPDDIAVGLTFGLMTSHDGGVTWQWMCEAALDTMGQVYSHYAYSASGSLFATTLDGLRVFRNQCSLQPLSIAIDKTDFASDQTLGPDGALYVASATGIHKSTDDGVTFPVNTVPAMMGDWWSTIRVAPSDPQRVYISGYRVNPDLTKTFLVYKSIDGGVSFQPMSIAEFTVTKDSAIEIAGISTTDADLVYARVTLESAVIGDALYRSTNGGASWTKILAKGDSLAAFVVRANGDIVAGTPTLGGAVSHDHGANWIDLVMPPHLNCLAENAAHEIWACTYNFGTMQVPPDGYALMKTTDLASWSPVMRFQDLSAPIPCAPGTLQKDTCEAMQWCPLVDQFGINSTTIVCDINPTVDAAPDMTAHPGCGCASGGGRDGAFVIAIALLALLGRRHRR